MSSAKRSVARGAVVVLGSLHLDVLVRVPRWPRPGETLPCTGWELRPGGKGGNQAVQAARHGADVSMVGAVGVDEFGRQLRANLEAHGVGVQQVPVVPGAPSGMSVAEVEPGGDYQAVIASGVNMMLGTADVERSRALLEHAAVLVLQNEVPAEVNASAARVAAAAGATVVLNAAPARPLGDELARHLGLLVVNAVEAEMLGGCEVASLEGAARAARQLLSLAPAVVVTAGSHGAAIATRAGVLERVPVRRVEAGSAHGAGDAFVGCLAARMAEGEALVAAVRTAAEAATRFVSGDTARPES
jgi:ribokinase